MVLSEAVEEYVGGRHGRGEIGAHTASVLRYRLMSVVRFVGDTDRLEPAQVAAWQCHIAWQRPRSRKALYSTLSAFCRWMVAEGLAERDPTVGLGRVREPVALPRALSPAQLARLVAVLPDTRARAIVALQGRLGLRCAEVANLTVEDWDRATNTLLVNGKFDNQRRLPVPDDVARVLEQHLDGRASGPMIGYSPHHISKQVSRWMTSAGVKSAPRDGFSAHALRHTAASDLYAMTRDVRLAQRLLGHANIATTDRYLRPGDLDELRRGLGGGR